MIVSVAQAVDLLKSDEVVAVPTETVYGLAGSIRSEAALKKIFEVKKRPFFDPLIVHVENSSQAQKYVIEWPLIAEVLTQKFWPGPLTILLKKNKQVSDLITAGLERVGLRCPRHPIALDILKRIKTPFAAPSANLFGRTSPTHSSHVEKEFESSVPVVEGGSSEIGIESTVLLIDGSEIAILRPGHILKTDIEKALQEKGLLFRWKETVSKAESPGHMKHHYMPSKPLFWIEGTPAGLDLTELLNNELAQLPAEVEGVQIVKPQAIRSFEYLKLPSLPREAARAVYAELRNLGESSTDCLVFFPEKFMIGPEWEPVLERLRKASSLIIKI
jgi:L-threonylcarbamoyladenylate synthase